LIGSPAQLRVAEELYPDVKFHAMREHGGRVFGEQA
jgi:peptide chain release factor 3